eukprot:g5449.t1
MAREKALALVVICAVAVIFTLQNLSDVVSRDSVAQTPREPALQLPPGARAAKVAICILTRRSEWQRRHLLRQTWLQDVPEGAQVSHIFVMGEDRSYTQEENARLAEEVSAHRDILIAPVEEASETKAAVTKHCIYWTTKNHDFDVLVKANDDSTLFLSRLFGTKGWLPPQAINRDELVYFGKCRALAKVANPANTAGSAPSPVNQAMTPEAAAAALGTNVDVDGVFEFDYRGVYWPEHMEGGMYGLSRALAEQIVKNDFRTYTSEEATVGVWVSAFRTTTVYLSNEQVLSSEADYLASDGTAVAAAFRTCRLRLASMWCEYAPLGTLSPRSILAKDARQTLDCLGSYERSSHAPRSLPLGASDAHHEATLKSLSTEWPMTERPDPEGAGRWWGQMRGAFRGNPAAVVGTSAATVDRLPLYLLQGMHTLVMDDFFRVSERYTSWAPTMYMCVDPGLCASPGDGGGSGIRASRKGRQGAVASNVESANRFARDVFAAFYVLSGGKGGAEYWRYLRQRANAHWFVAGIGDGGSGSGGARGELGGGTGHGVGAAGGGRGGVNISTGVGPLVGGAGAGAGGGDWSVENFRVSSQSSGLAMAVEVLSFLGFSPIYVAAANEELGGKGGKGGKGGEVAVGAQQQRQEQSDEFSGAVKLAGSSYGTSFVYLYAEEDDKLPNSMVGTPPGGSEAAAAGQLDGQESFLAWAQRRKSAGAQKQANWDLEAFLQNFPVVNRLEIVRGASSVDDMFPRSPKCRDAQDLDRYQKAVLCNVKTSLKHFSSFLAWHVPYGPVRGTFVHSPLGASVKWPSAAAAAADDFLTFCVNLDELPEQLAMSRDYRVVAVTGCQCSGKSTLLNALFGTGFPVLEHSDDDDTLPGRTTVGAWVDLQLCSPPRRKKPQKLKPDTATSSAMKSARRINDGSSSSSKKRSTSTSTAAAASARSKVRTQKRRAKAGTAAATEAKTDKEGGRGEAASSSSSPSSEAASASTGARRRAKRAAKGAAVGRGMAAAAETAVPPPTPFVLVDVEGTQSRDRGGADGMAFDSRTTLFAVMAADVIMLNLWAHDVGRADGQAYSVLRSVFEEAVRLYQAEGQDAGGDGCDSARREGEEGAVGGGPARFPKVLMLVLRDVEEEEHFEALDKAARANMEALWHDVDKPSSLRDAGLSEMFDLRTSGLPHFVYQRREFAAKAAALSRSFLEPSHESFVFPKPSSPRQRANGGEEGQVKQRAKPGGRAGWQQAVVPLSELRQRLEGIWASASSNRRLAEAPRRSEQEGAVAVTALAESCLSEVRPRCARLLVDVEEAAGAGAMTMPLLQFGSDAKGIVDSALLSFQARASRSQPPIYVPQAVLRDKRRWLVTAVARELEPAFRAHARHLRGHFHEQFEEVFSCVLGGAADFDQTSRRMTKAVRGNFLAATKLAIPETPGVADVWRLHWEAELVKLNEDMESRVQDRLSEGTWMLPPDPAEQAAAAAKKKTPWWKGLILRAAAMYFNYLQATQHLRRARKASEKRERDVPRLPLF